MLPPCQLYLNHLLFLKYSNHTIRNYSRDLACFTTFLTANSLTEETVKMADARRHLALLRKQGLQGSSIKRHCSTLMGYYNFLLQQNVVKINPFQYVAKIKKRSLLPKQLFYQDIVSMIAYCGDDLWGRRDRAILETLYSTGCRAFELVALNKSDVYNRTSLAIKGKGERYRYIFFTIKAQQALKNYLAVKGKGERLTEEDGRLALFINSDGSRLTTRGLYYIVKQYEQCLDNGRKVGVHLFRHSFAGHLLDEGANLRAVQELLGHKSLSTTQIYTHIALERVKELYRTAHPHGKSKRLVDKEAP